MALNMSNVEIHPPHHHIKEISIGNSKPRSPNRCRANNAPVTIRCIIPHTNLRFYFTFTVLRMWAIVMLILNFIPISRNKFRGRYYDFLQIGQFMNNLHKIFNAGNILVIIFKCFSIQIGSCRQMNNIVRIKADNCLFKIFAIDNIHIFPKIFSGRNFRFIPIQIFYFVSFCKQVFQKIRSNKTRCTCQ